jgi:hypothetical protein
MTIVHCLLISKCYRFPKGLGNNNDKMMDLYIISYTLDPNQREKVHGTKFSYYSYDLYCRVSNINRCGPDPAALHGSSQEVNSINMATNIKENQFE